MFLNVNSYLLFNLKRYNLLCSFLSVLKVSCNIQVSNTLKLLTLLSILLDTVASGDTVLVTKIDKLARSIIDLKELVQTFLDKGVAVSFIDNNLLFIPNKKDSMQTLMLNMLGSFAEFERDLIVTRTAEGKAFAKATNPNYKEGRPVRRLTKQYLHAIELMDTHTMKEVEQKTGISRATLFRIKKQYKEEQIAKEQ